MGVHRRAGWDNRKAREDSVMSMLSGFIAIYKIQDISNNNDITTPNNNNNNKNNNNFNNINNILFKVQHLKTFNRLNIPVLINLPMHL